jgi:hypothetical protein
MTCRYWAILARATPTGTIPPPPSRAAAALGAATVLVRGSEQPGTPLEAFDMASTSWRPASQLEYRLVAGFGDAQDGAWRLTDAQAGELFSRLGGTGTLVAA